VRPREQVEHGFTLVELLVVITIMPLIVGAVAYAFITLLADQGRVTNSINDSSDSQIVATYYTPDIQSASQFTTDTAANSPTNPDQCGSTGTQVLGLEWGGYLPTGANTESYETVVSYDVVPTGSNGYSLVRYYCASGYSVTPTTAITISNDVPSTLTATIAPNTITGQSAGWVSVQGVTAITFAITEPTSGYSYSLTADPSTASGQEGAGGSPTNPTTSCGFAAPTTGTYASNLCFVNLAGIDFTAADSATPVCPQAEGITGTPFAISFCLRWTPVSGCTTRANPSGSGGLAAAALPTYASPPTKEAFLGTNGFYVGVPGETAFYTQVDDCVANIFLTNIEVTDATGQQATGWELVTGDAESTDESESIVWSTCPSLTSLTYPASDVSGTGNNSPFGVSTGSGCTSSDPDLDLLDNSPTSPFGNACADSAVTSTGYTTPASYAAGVYLTGVSTQSVECGAAVGSDKTGTVMLEAAAPSTLSISLIGAEGNGLEAAFVGVLLP